MAAVLAIFGQQMQVVTRNVEGARVSWRPKPHQRALAIVERKFGLMAGRSHEISARVSPAGNAIVDGVEHAVDAKCHKQII